MAKLIKYRICSRVNHGTEEEPQIKEIMSAVTMTWNEANEELAKEEAYNGEYAIEDDGQSEVNAPTQEERIAELEEALDMLLNGVTE